MKKERIFYLDFIKAIAVIIVVVYHFNCHFVTNNIIGFNNIFYKYANGDWGDIGVTLFFIISGAALMHTYNKDINYKSYAIKRFKRIYPMFWIAYTVAFLYFFYINKGIVQVPKIRLLLTLVGMDGYFLYTLPNFYILGEWFLGAIIFIYILFPICRKFIKSNKKLATVLILSLLVLQYAILYYYNFKIEPMRNIIVCISSFMFGMYFIEYIKDVKWYHTLIVLPLFIVLLIIKMPLSNRVFITVCGTLLFLILVQLSYFINNKFIKSFSEILSKYSYAIFLVHHVVIMQVEKRFFGMTLKKIEVLSMFMICVIVTGIFAKLLYETTNYIITSAKNMCKKELKGE